MDAFCWELESSERDIFDVARVDSFTNSRCLHHRQKLFCDDYHLNILAYHQEYLIYHDYWSNHLVPHLEQRHKVGQMDSHYQMNSSHYHYYLLHFWHSEGGRTVLFVSELVVMRLELRKEDLFFYSPVLLAAPSSNGGSCCQGSWIAVSNVAWTHVSTWMQASLQCKTNKSVGCLRWTTWWLPLVVLGSLFETHSCKVGIFGALLSDNFVPFGKTNVLETLTYKIEECWTVFHERDEVSGSNRAWLGATHLVITRWPCCIPIIWHFKRLLCLKSS